MEEKRDRPAGIPAKNHPIPGLASSESLGGALWLADHSRDGQQSQPLGFRGSSRVHL